MKDGRVAVLVGPRAYPYRGITYSPGRVIHVSAATADRMEGANPPYGRRVEKGAIDERGQVDPWEQFTETARQKLEDSGLSALAYTGPRQNDGRVHASDVSGWLADNDAEDG